MWERSRQSEGERYDNVMDDLQMIGRRNMLCGMHVHVEMPDPEKRVDVMTRILPYVPLLIALSTSSPFWRSRPTGLQGYRLAAYDELPRTGIPELFKTKAQFEAYSEALVRAGVMPDSSYIWWAVRPSLKHPTLELRAPDSCTRIEDSIAIASLYRSLVRRLSFNPWQNWDMNAVSRAIIVENKWRAQRYGVHGTFAQHRGRRAGDGCRDAGSRDLRGASAMPRRSAVSTRCCIAGASSRTAPRPTGRSASTISSPTIPNTRCGRWPTG